MLGRVHIPGCYDDPEVVSVRIIFNIMNMDDRTKTAAAFLYSSFRRRHRIRRSRLRKKLRQINRECNQMMIMFHMAMFYNIMIATAVITLSAKLNEIDVSKVA